MIKSGVYFNRGKLFARNGARRLTDDPGDPGNRPPSSTPPLGLVELGGAFAQ